MNIPLSTFAYDLIDERYGEFCQVFVEYLDPNQPQSSNIIVGAMFFQSFLGVFTVNPNGDAQQVVLQLYTQSDSYVLPGTFIGN